MLINIIWTNKMVDVPSIPEPDSYTAKFALLWVQNKPLAIFYIFLITLLILGIIFLIVWFTLIAPKQNKQTPKTLKTT